MSFTVTLQPRAEEDSDKIYAWLRKRSPLGAVKWFVALQIALRDLADRPERFPQAAEARRIGRDVRQSFFQTRRGDVIGSYLPFATQKSACCEFEGQGNDR